MTCILVSPWARVNSWLAESNWLITRLTLISRYSLDLLVNQQPGPACPDSPSTLRASVTESHSTHLTLIFLQISIMFCVLYYFLFSPLSLSLSLSGYHQSLTKNISNLWLISHRICMTWIRATSRLPSHPWVKASHNVMTLLVTHKSTHDSAHQGERLTWLDLPSKIQICRETNATVQALCHFSTNNTHILVIHIKWWLWILF